MKASLVVAVHLPGYASYLCVGKRTNCCEIESEVRIVLWEKMYFVNLNRF